MSSVPVYKRNHVLAFVALHHNQQVRKYTGESYVRHLQSVAKMADGQCRLGYEIGLCHDLLEDTNCMAIDLYIALVRWGYTNTDAWFIVNRVIDLTDVFTPEAAPKMNRKARKRLEAKRLWEIHPVAQTVKYCDLMDNTSSIVEHDKGFAKVYLIEKSDILYGMNKGNKALYNRVKKTLFDGFKKINYEHLAEDI